SPLCNTPGQCCMGSWPTCLSLTPRRKCTLTAKWATTTVTPCMQQSFIDTVRRVDDASHPCREIEAESPCYGMTRHHGQCKPEPSANRPHVGSPDGRERLYRPGATRLCEDTSRLARKRPLQHWSHNGLSNNQSAWAHLDRFSSVGNQDRARSRPSRRRPHGTDQGWGDPPRILGGGDLAGRSAPEACQATPESRAT